MKLASMMSNGDMADSVFPVGQVEPLARSLGVRTMIWLVTLIPSIFVMAPLVGGAFEKTVLVFRMIVGPLILLLMVRRAIHWTTFLPLIALIIGTSYEGIVRHGDDFMLVSLAFVGSIILYRVGFVIAQSPRNCAIWDALAYGVSVVNIITILVLAATAVGLIDVEVLLNLLNKDVDFGLARFAIGNPIEIPFVMCALLYAGIRNSSSGKRYLISASLNLVIAGISQSRVIIVIAVLIFMRQWWRSDIGAKLFVSAVLGVLLMQAWDVIVPVFESVMARFGGDDFGSGDDRAYLFDVVFQNLGALGLFIGHGLTSAASLLLDVLNTYRTVESTALQMLYEIGIVGIALLVATLSAGLPRGKAFVAWFDPITIFMWIQLLFFLPINPLLPLAAFGIGASMWRPHSVFRVHKSAETLDDVNAVSIGDSD